MARLSVVVPVALAVIFLLLYLMFGSARLATLIFFNVPFAAVGGIFALALRGMPFSISAAVGFIALFGIAILNGVVMAPPGADDGDRCQPRLPANGTFEKLRRRSAASARHRRLISATVLALLVLPALYSWFCPARSSVHATARRRLFRAAVSSTKLHERLTRS
ncbi:cobalt-zinc-cadmium resistance protein CzcA [Bradyrhizobium erythrophlei]|uniref:Cobalt-zinc-cadmium resistance protein CzcA n=1 Tax=Bradyrhizobium erythrophlei TaxID=1437360 RepID=A0A1H4UN93_9BRAD|nr:efflux RND transporter permease subunit [Bradyrhizobium erythrophlei]SEC70219.1 cobalt-zinc-cadmium resistance protein CzcA [Bradyrhizobium erythrophlei]